MAPTIEWAETDEETGDEVVHRLPARFEVCGRCEGRGKHVNPAIDAHGLTREDFESDPDFEDAYFSGRYDIACVKCLGLRVVPVVDEARCAPEVLQRYMEDRRLAAKWDAEDRATQRMEEGRYGDY
jgi:hypothetical protein